MFPESGDGDPQYRRPLWFAALVTVLGTPFLFLAVTYLAAYVSSHLLHASLAGGIVPHEPYSWGYIVGTVLIGVPVSAFCLGLVGMPLILLLRRHNWLTVPAVWLAAAIAGGVGFVAFVALVFHNPPEWWSAGFGAAVGLGGGVLFSAAAGLGFRRLRMGQLPT